MAQMEHHRAAVVYKALDLNAAILKQWAGQFEDVAPNERDDSQDFIALTSDVPSTKTQCQLSLTLRNGVQIKVDGTCIPQSVRIVAASLLENFNNDND